MNFLKAAVLSLSFVPSAMSAQDAAGNIEVAKVCGSLVAYISRVGNANAQLGGMGMIMIGPIRAEFDREINTAVIVLGSSARNVMFDELDGFFKFDAMTAACGNPSGQGACDWTVLSSRANSLAGALFTACIADYSGT